MAIIGDDTDYDPECVTDSDCGANSTCEYGECVYQGYGGDTTDDTTDTTDPCDGVSCPDGKECANGNCEWREDGPGTCPDGEEWDPGFDMCIDIGDDTTDDGGTDDGGTDDTTDTRPTLNSVGTSAFNVYPSSDPNGGGDNTEPQLQADVTNGSTADTVTVWWYFGDQKVTGRTLDLDPYETRTFARRVSWSELDADGLVPGDYTLSAELIDTGAETSYGTMHLFEGETADGGDDTTDDGDTTAECTNDADCGANSICVDGECVYQGYGGDDGDTSSDLLPDNIPLLPAVGPFNAEQVTLGAILGVPLLVVLLK